MRVKHKSSTLLSFSKTSYQGMETGLDVLSVFHDGNTLSLSIMDSCLHPNLNWN